MCNITINRLQLIKETTKRYAFSRQITSEEKAVKIFNEVFHLNESANEQCCAIFTDTKLKLVATHVI